MSKFTCPYCYGQHDLRAVDMKCSFNIPGKPDKCVHTGSGQVQKDARGFIPVADKSRCAKCQSAKKIYFCPETKKEIPSDFLEEKNGFSIALLGAKATGKSNYIGVLVHEIRKKMTARFNCTLSLSSSEESKMYYDRYYYEPLFKSGKVVQATTAGDEIPPMIFPLRFLDNKNRISKTAILSFYDTAGENLDSKSDMHVRNRYIPNADGIIILLDPLQVPAIREQLEGKIPLPAQNSDVIDVLSRVVETIREVKNVRGTIKTPIALVFTKIDALEEFDILRDDSILKEESEHLNRGVFVNTDFESVDIEIRDLLENWLDAELIQLMKNFEKCSFFGLTSLGGVPKGDNLGGKIKPRRVLDPLLWLLAEGKYIKVAKK